MKGRQPHLVVPGAADLEDTAELPALQLPDGGATSEGEPAAAHDETGGGAPPASQATPESAFPTPGSQPEALTRLEDDLRGLTSSLRSLEGELGRKSEQIQAYERDVGARDAQIAALQSELTAVDLRYRDLEALEAGQSVKLAMELEQREILNAQLAQLKREIATQTEQRAVLNRAQERLQQRLDGVEITLAEARQLAERYREALQDQEGRRGFFDSLLRERDRAVGEHQARTLMLEQMHLDLKQAASVREQEISAQLVQQQGIVATLGTQLEAAKSQLDAVRTELGDTQASVDRHQNDLAIERARSQGLAERCDELQSRLEQTLSGGQQSEDKLRAQERENHDLQEMIRALQNQLAEARASEEKASADLRAAEDSLRGVESDLRHRDVQIARIEQNERETRVRLEAASQQLEERNRLIARLESEAAASAQVIGNIRSDLDRMSRVDLTRGNVHPVSGASGATGRTDTASAPQFVHLLVRTEGDSGIVHVLGRRTTIGRKEDNDLRIEADFISRHHALMIINDSEAIIEDLHSANGVYVNGLRVSRKALMEGDLVTIGKSEFRYVRKPAAERGN